MEYVQGCKINDRESIENMGFKATDVADKLIEIMAKMIFKHGFVHCDAHPGNILIRKDPTGPDFQIVLLDHGMYKELDKQFLNNFSRLWIGMMEFSKQKIKRAAEDLKISEHLEYLPILFLNRTKDSRKKIG